MKLHVDALIVIAIFYFADWAYNKIDPPEPQCYYQVENVVDGEGNGIIGGYRDCLPGDNEKLGIIKLEDTQA